MKRKGARKKERDDLRDLLKRRLDELVNRAKENEGELDNRDVRSLKKLNQLVALYDAQHTPSANRRWLPAVTLLVTLVIVSVLLFVRLPATPIELDLTSAAVSFVLPKQQPLLDDVELSSLSVTDLREIETVLASASAPPETFSSADGQGAIHLSTVASGDSKSGVTLKNFVLPAGSRIWVTAQSSPRQFRILVNLSQAPATEFELQATVSGDIETRLGNLASKPNVTSRPIVAQPNPSPRQGLAAKLKFANSRPVVMRPNSSQFSITLTFPSDSTLLSPSMTVESLSFSTVNQFVDPGMPNRNLSQILSASIYYESLSDKETKLRAGEALEFDQTRGVIRSADVREDGLRLKFNGIARGMKKGTGDASRSIMPTWLEWLTSNQALALMWGATTYLFLLTLSLLKWWGLTK